MPTFWHVHITFSWSRLHSVHDMTIMHWCHIHTWIRGHDMIRVPCITVYAINLFTRILIFYTHTFKHITGSAIHKPGVIQWGRTDHVGDHTFPQQSPFFGAEKMVNMDLSQYILLGLLWRSHNKSNIHVHIHIYIYGYISGGVQMPSFFEGMRVCVLVW